MAAISKAWVTIADAAVDPDSPGDTTLMTGIRDDLVHLREWLGASFFAGAVQDHNHDGSNSALIEVGPNLLRNGSFEEDGAGWTITDYSGGSHAFSTSTRHHGAKSLSFTSTSTANGGGDALSNEFMPIAGPAGQSWGAEISASVANVSSRISVVWYDAAQSQISEVNLYDTTNTPTTKTSLGGIIAPPATARFAKIRVKGGVPGAGSATGTIFFDGVHFATDPANVMHSGSISINSGTFVNYSGILQGAKRVTISFKQVGLTNADDILVQLGTSGGMESSGYRSSGGLAITAAATTVVSSTAGFLIRVGDGNASFGGHMVLTLLDPTTNTWACSYAGITSTGTFGAGGGDKALSGELTQIQINRSATGSFDGAGVFSVMSEK